MKPLTLPVFISCLCLAGLAKAADLTAPNAAFTWTNANAWSGGTATWNSGTPDNAIFGTISTDRTANLTSAITAGNISFSNPANRWTVSGSNGQITLNGSLTKSGAGNVTISSNTLLTGAGSVTIDAGELQLLNNANNFSGGVTLNGGTLRVGNASGTGTPQTAGSLGTGTFTINGGTIFQNQGNVRTQAVAAVIGGNFAFNSVAAGGLLIGSTNGTRTVDLGNASRTITVSQNSDGTGADSYFGMRDLINSAGGAIVKEGAGVLRIQGTSTAGVTVNAGSLEVTAALGATNFTMNSGTVWRRTTTETPTLGSKMVLNGASLVNADTLNNSRASAFNTLQISGTSSVFLGQGLNIQSSGTTTGAGFNVRSGGILGGSGTIQTAGTQSYASGVTTMGSLTDSAITLSAGGSIRPGTPDSLNSTIGKLSFGSLIWNGEASSIAQMSFNLGAANNSDNIDLSGTLTKGTGSIFEWDFGGTGVAGGVYDLLTFSSSSGFSVTDFSFSNLASGLTAKNDSGFTDGFRLTSTSLQFAAVPEPSGVLAGMLLLGALMHRRRA
jgi:autotransporter-associated beta strand protein